MNQSPILLMAPLYGPTQQALESRYTVHRLWEAPDAGALLASLADGCRVVVTTGGKGIDAATMAKLPKLELVACFGVGVDAIDLEYCRKRGIAVTNTPDVLTDEVADLALALLLATVRRIPYGDRFVREGKWLKGGMPLTQSLGGRKVGIVGLGRIGSAIAKRCESFGTTIGWYGPRPKPGVKWQHFGDVVELARWADVLIAACPGGPATHRIVSRAALEALGPDGIFVNIARGSVVDQDAMVELLGNGKLGSAGLDVFDDEPNVPQALIGMENVVLQPHMGSGTHPTRTEMGRLVLENVAAWTEGKPLVTQVS
ncbi:2-hydroxyacid dehydrogenase [Burkholderiaceae bacterium FT117]|uniref:2-hydroxyacid dehydrogenase n=1 Tax=Zeimonas sediminis TaxID=2944268 RepID=UPI002342FE45|nr:2-hydroxyacid dehydrogenase [Zeimonas sediminis]MCM5570719.1 2-hydroxyacid dehydrogenase [Zeimonas sediminis]